MSPGALVAMSPRRESLACQAYGLSERFPTENPLDARGPGVLGILDLNMMKATTWR